MDEVAPDRDRLEALARRIIAFADAASLGPWTFDDAGRIHDAEGYVVASLAERRGHVDLRRDSGTGEFIAHTRTAAPELARALLDALGRIDVLQEELDSVTGDRAVWRFLGRDESTPIEITPPPHSPPPPLPPRCRNE